MKKFLNFLDSLEYHYEIQDKMVIVLNQVIYRESDYKHIVIPENIEFRAGLNLYYCESTIQLPEKLTVNYELDLRGTNVNRLPSGLTIDDDCSVYLDAHKIENVSYCDDCGTSNRQIFAFWANNDFLIAAGCFAGNYSNFAERVDMQYYDEDALEYKLKAQSCISELAEKLGKPDPFKNQ